MRTLLPRINCVAAWLLLRRQPSSMIRAAAAGYKHGRHHVGRHGCRNAVGERHSTLNPSADGKAEVWLSRRAATETAAWIELQLSRPDRQTAESARRCSSRHASRAGPLADRWIRRRCLRKQQPAVTAAARSKQRPGRTGLGLLLPQGKAGASCSSRLPGVCGARGRRANLVFITAPKVAPSGSLWNWVV